MQVYEELGNISGTKSIVHFEITAPDLIERAAKIDNLFINFTPTWAFSLITEEIEPVTSRRDIICLYKETKDAGVTVNFGADSNGIEECWNPVLMIVVSMRRNPDEEGLFLKGKTFDFEEAVDAYTINVAKERRVDDVYGSIEVGKSADFVVWNVDEFTEQFYNVIEQMLTQFNVCVPLWARSVESVAHECYLLIRSCQNIRNKIKFDEVSIQVHEYSK